MVDASPFRTATIHCPRCRTAELTAGELRHCPRCRGAWIPHELLASHVGAMQFHTAPALAWSVASERLGLPCAVCRHRMEPLNLFGVPADRCHSHGVWFDHGRLAEVLRRSAAHAPSTAPANMDGALAVGQVGAEVGLQASAEVTGGILEGVLDVIGGIFSAIDV